MFLDVFNSDFSSYGSVSSAIFIIVFSLIILLSFGVGVISLPETFLSHFFSKFRFIFRGKKVYLSLPFQVTTSHGEKKANGFLSRIYFDSFDLRSSESLQAGDFIKVNLSDLPHFEQASKDKLFLEGQILKKNTDQSFFVKIVFISEQAKSSLDSYFISLFKA